LIDELQTVMCGCAITTDSINAIIYSYKLLKHTELALHNVIHELELLK